MPTTTTGEPFEVVLGWQFRVPGGLFTHHCQYAFSDETTLPFLKARCASHAMVDVLPDRAITELIETLREMVSFYNNLPSSCLSLPSKEVQAKAGETYQRPSFQIVEE